MKDLRVWPRAGGPFYKNNINQSRNVRYGVCSIHLWQDLSKYCCGRREASYLQQRGTPRHGHGSDVGPEMRHFVSKVGQCCQNEFDH